MSIVRVLRERVTVPPELITSIPLVYKELLDSREHAFQNLQESEDLASLFQTSQHP